MKSVCIIASDNVVIDGDVIFLNQYKFGSEIAVFVPVEVKNLRFSNKGLIVFFNGERPSIGLRLKLLWLWHMVILRKSHVYLTGVLK